jgi:hypothetical protein
MEREGEEMILGGWDDNFEMVWWAMSKFEPLIFEEGDEVALRVGIVHGLKG